MTDENKEILSKEIRGITGRTIWAFVIGVILMTSSVVITYSNIMSKLDLIYETRTSIKELKEKVIPALDKRILIIEQNEKHHD